MKSHSHPCTTETRAPRAGFVFLVHNLRMSAPLVPILRIAAKLSVMGIQIEPCINREGRFYLRKLEFSDVEAIYECPHCPGCGCPVFNIASGFVPDEVLEHLSNHILMCRGLNPVPTLAKAPDSGPSSPREKSSK